MALRSYKILCCYQSVSILNGVHIQWVSMKMASAVFQCYSFSFSQAQHDPAVQVTLSSHSTKAQVVDQSCNTSSSLVLSNSNSKVPVSCSTAVRFNTKAPMAHSGHGTKVEWLTKSEDEMDTKTSHQSILQTKQTIPLKEVKVEKSPGKGDTDYLALEKSGKVPHNKLQSYAEPGPSTCSSSSEDEEKGYWAYKKRVKKPKHPSGKVRV